MPVLNGISLWELIKVPLCVSHSSISVVCVCVAREGSCDEEEGVGENGVCASNEDGDEEALVAPTILGYGPS